MKQPVSILYKSILLPILLLVAFAANIQNIQAQTTHPVQANVYLAPPYSNYLSDYYTTSKEKLVVTLLNRDQQRPTLDVRLRVSVTAVNGLKIQSREEINYPIITLDAGIPTRLTQNDLEPYFLPRNINTQGSLNQGKLPEGMIEFTFQVIERHTGKVLSAPATGRVWLSSQKPPILRLPSNNENVAFSDPLNLKFQWEPLHKNLSQVEYEFELKELPNTGVAPQSAFLYAIPIYRERLVHTYLMYNVMMPPLDPDKVYAWRVRAIAKDGVDDLNMFDNSGYSEVFCLRTASNCQPPFNCSADLKDRTLTLNWLPSEGNNEYMVQYRLKNDAKAEWKEGKTYDTQQTLYDMKRGATYEFRVGSICTSGQPVFTPTGEITIPAVDSARLARCGIPGTFNLENKEPIESLKSGDVVMVNDYPMTLTQVAGGGGSFSGEGWVPVNWLLNTKWEVEFDNITVNTDRQMVAGSVRAKYDETEGQIAKVDEITEGGHENTREGIIFPNYELEDRVIPPNPTFEYDPQSGELTIYTTDGQQVGEPVKLKNDGKEVFPITIKDKEGNIYQVDTQKDEKGEPVVDENGKPKLESNCLGKQGEALSKGSFNQKALSEKTAVVTFEKGNGIYALDEWRPIYKEIPIIRKEYDKLADDYYASWKFLPVGGSDKVIAHVVIDRDALTNIVPDSIIFATPQGVRFDAKAQGNNRYEITIAAGQDRDVQEIYALYPKKGSSSQYLTLGKLNVATYEKQENELVVLQVDATVNGAGLEKKLNEIYNPVGVHWKVKILPFSVEDKELLKDFIDEKSGFLSMYNDKMKNLITQYKKSNQIDSKASYIFLLKENGVSAQNANKRDAAGFMPRGEQFGFIFTNRVDIDELNYIFAHELGHGKWRLPHTFDDYGQKMSKHSTDNLMDYADSNKSGDYKNKVHLAKWQWELLSSPAWFTNPFEGDEKGMVIGKTDIEESIKNASDMNILHTGSTTFMTPAGTIIKLPDNYKSVSFTSLYSRRVPNGALIKFLIDDLWWLAYYGNDFKTFLGYILEKDYKKGVITYYQKEILEKAENVTLGFNDNCHILLKNYYVGDKELSEGNQVKEINYFENLSDVHIIGEPIYDSEACKVEKDKFKILDLNKVMYEVITPTNSKYKGRIWKIPYMGNWSGNYKNNNIDYFYQIDSKGISLTPNMELNPLTTSIKRPVFVSINSPMTLDVKIELEEKAPDRLNPDEPGTKYFDEVYGADIYTPKQIKTAGFAFSDYIEIVEEWKSKNYKPTTDPDFQSPKNIENLARAIIKGGVLNPVAAGGLKFDKIYDVDNCFYSGEEYSYYIFGYAANRYFNFYHVDWGRAFAMQYLNAELYDPRTYGEITDAPWLVKAFNRGWAKANNMEGGYAPTMYEEYALGEDYLTDGLTVADMVDATLWVYGAGAVKKITVKVTRDAIIGAYINWQVQILIKMICGESYEDAVANVDYSGVVWSGLTSAIENDKTIMVLNCVQAAIEEYEKKKEVNLSVGYACGIEIMKHRMIKRFLSDKNSVYGKYLHKNLKKQDHSKTEFLRKICITFNCHSDTALEIMRIVPAEITDAMHGSWDDVEKLIKDEKR